MKPCSRINEDNNILAPSTPSSRLPVLLCFLIPGLFWFLAYGHLLWSELYWGDVGLYFYPMWDYVRDSLREGRLPFWNPYINGGQPLIGNPQMGVFYPTTPLLYFLSTERWLSLTTALHLLFSGYGMFAFLNGILSWRSNSQFFESESSRSTIHSLLSSTFGACAWIGCTAVAARIQFPPMLWAICYYPWILYGIERLVQQPDRKRVVLLGVLMGLCILCAHPQASYMIGLIGIVYFLFRWRQIPSLPPSTGSRRKVFLSGVLACLLALGLSAVYWLPVSAFAQETDASNKSLFHANRFYLPFTQILNPALPFLFGSPDKLYVGRGNFWEPTAFIGIIPLILGVGFIRVLWRSEWKSLARFAFTVFLITYWLALGKHAGLYTVAYYALPGLKMFHDPARWLLISCLMLCVLAALGYCKLTDRSHCGRKSLIFGAVACSTLYLFLPAEYYSDFLLRGYKPSFWYTYPFVNRAEAIQTVADGLRTSLLWLGTGLALFAISWTFTRLRSSLLWIGFAFFQIWFVHALIPSVPSGSWVQAKNQLKNLEGTWYAVRPFEGWRRFVSYVAYDNSPTRLLDYAGAMMPNLPMLAQVSVWNAYEPVQPERVVKVREAASETGENGLPNTRWMQCMGVSTLLDVSREWKVVFTSPPSPYPRIDLSERAEPVSSLVEVIERFRSPRHSPEQITLVEGLEKAVSPIGLRSSPDSVQILSDNPEYLRLKVSTPSERLLVVRETLLPGWEGLVAQQPARLYYADGVFRSLLIPPGEHTVELRYYPPRFRAGLIVSVLSSVGMVILMVGSYRKARARE